MSDLIGAHSTTCEAGGAAAWFAAAALRAASVVNFRKVIDAPGAGLGRPAPPTRSFAGGTGAWAVSMMRSLRCSVKGDAIVERL